MKITPNLVQWQREGYPHAHQDRFNLIIHLFTSPLFNLGLLALIFCVIQRSVELAVSGFGLIFLTLVLQGFGHSREEKKPEPFLSPLDLVVRFTIENTFNFWRFVFSGEYLRALRKSQK